MAVLVLKENLNTYFVTLSSRRVGRPVYTNFSLYISVVTIGLRREGGKPNLDDFIKYTVFSLKEPLMKKNKTKQNSL